MRRQILRDFPPTDDPEVRERQRHILRVLLDKDPEARQLMIELGRKEGCQMVYERRLGRALSRVEREVMLERWGWLGEGRLLDVVLAASPEALAAWLADPDAR